MIQKSNIYVWLILFFGCIAYPQSGESSSLTQQQQAGKMIYTKGLGNSTSKVTAVMSGINVPATVMTCINCHNAKGTGNPEGGIIPSNITWTHLTKSYGGKRQDQSTRPAYDEKSLRKVITTGFDSGGNQLHNAMPKYNMSRDDLNNLIEYLKVIGSDVDTGLTDATIRVGIVLPENNNDIHGKNDAIKRMVNAYCNNVNSTGGIYQRKIVPQFFTAIDETAENQCFILLGFETNSFAQYARDEEIPTLFSFPLERASSGFKNQFTFYIYPSLLAQSLSLVDFSSQQKILKKNITIVYANDPARKAIADEVGKYFYKIYGKQSKTLPISSETILNIVNENDITSDHLLYYIGSSELGNQLLDQLAAIDKLPNVLVPGSLAGIDLFNLPKAFQNKVFIGYPTWVSEQTLSGRQTRQNLSNKYQLSNNWGRAQTDILSLLLTTEECLKRAGKDLSRNTFKETMEKLFEYSNGLSPSLSFNLNQHVGSPKIYIAGFNSEKNKMDLITTISSTEK